MKQYKNPESVLVVIYTLDSHKVLMLQRRDDPDFWQSVTGSLESGEIPFQTAIREVKEEVGIDILAEKLTLINADRTVEYEIFSHFRHRYAPNVSHNKEHWFYLPLASERQLSLTEHQAYQWLNIDQAADLTKSWSNRDAINEILIK